MMLAKCFLSSSMVVYSITPHLNSESFLIRRYSGFNIIRWLGIQIQKNVTTPRNALTSVFEAHGPHWSILDIFVLSGCRPSESQTNPTSSIAFMHSCIFFPEIVRPARSSFRSVLSMFCICSSTKRRTLGRDSSPSYCVRGPLMATSSRNGLATLLSRLRSTFIIIRTNWATEFITPYGRVIILRRPSSIWNPVRFLQLSSSSTWSYPESRSRTDVISIPVKSSINSSILGSR